MAFSREGFTADVVASFIRRTLLNPGIILILALSHAISYINSYLLTAIPLLQVLQPSTSWTNFLNIWIFLGIYTHLTSYLNDQFANNWTTDTYDWKKEIVLVTGGSSGIGAALTSLLLKRNPSTTIVIIDYSPLTFKPPPGSKVYYYQGDLSDSSVIRHLSERIRNEVGHPTVLVNNAGLIRGATVMEGSYADVEITIKTNLIAPFLLTKEFLPEMVRRNHGHIVSMGSMSAVTPPGRIADYAATKAGLMAFTEALQLELKHVHNAPKVRQSLLIPFFIKTPLIKGDVGQPNFLYPLLHVDTVAETLADILYSGRGRTVYLPGFPMVFIHKLRVLPEWLFRLAREETMKFGIDFTGRQKLDEKTGGLS